MSEPRHSFGTKRNGDQAAYRTLADFAIASEPGNEREVMAQVAAAVQELSLSSATLARLETAVAEATMNAMEHGNAYRPEVPVTVQVLVSGAELHVLISDHGGRPIPPPSAAAPDLAAKLEGRQSPRGWGLFLIENMVDEIHVTTDETHHTIELVLHLKGGDGARETKTG